MHSIVIIRPSILQVMLLKYMKLPHQGQSFKSWQRSWRQEFQNHDTTCCRTRKAGLMQGISIYRERTRKLLSAHQHVQVLLSLTLCEWQQYELHRKRFISQSNNNFPFFFPDAELQQFLRRTNKNPTRKAPVCKKCGHPRKGHKKGQCSSTT